MLGPSQTKMRPSFAARKYKADTPRNAVFFRPLILALLQWWGWVGMSSDMPAALYAGLQTLSSTATLILQ
jgi:hypothetical protein